MLKKKFGIPRWSNNKAILSLIVTSINGMRLHEDEKPTIKSVVFPAVNSTIIPESAIDELQKKFEKE